MQYKVTAKNFETFKRHAESWVKLFGLSDWRVECVHVKIPSGSMSQCQSNSDNRFAKLNLNTTWSNTRPTDEELRRAAIHEVAHLLLADLFHVAKERFVQRVELEDAEERVAIRMENAFVNLVKE